MVEIRAARIVPAEPYVPAHIVGTAIYNGVPFNFKVGYVTHEFQTSRNVPESLYRIYIYPQLKQRFPLWAKLWARQMTDSQREWLEHVRSMTDSNLRHADATGKSKIHKALLQKGYIQGPRIAHTITPAGRRALGDFNAANT